MPHPPRLRVALAVALSLLPLACGHKVTVGKYEQHGPTATTHPDGSVTATTGGRTFKLVEVEKQR